MARGFIVVGMETERRTERRFRLARMIAYDMGREQYLRAQGVDISRGGMAFISDEYVDPLLSVWLSFSIPEGEDGWRTIESEGYVANVTDLEDGCRFGVSFTRMAPEDRTALDAFMARLERDGFEGISAEGDSSAT